MKRRNRSIRHSWAKALVVMLALGLPVVAATAGTQRNAPVSPAEAARYAGNESCKTCHLEICKAFEATPHGKAVGNSPREGCEGCHGPGKAHVESHGDKNKIFRFGTDPGEASERCLSCHQYGEAQGNLGGSQHDMKRVN